MCGHYIGGNFPFFPSSFPFPFWPRKIKQFPFFSFRFFLFFSANKSQIISFFSSFGLFLFLFSIFQLQIYKENSPQKLLKIPVFRVSLVPALRSVRISAITLRSGIGMRSFKIPWKADSTNYNFMKERKSCSAPKMLEIGQN